MPFWVDDDDSRQSHSPARKGILMSRPVAGSLCASNAEGLMLSPRLLNAVLGPEMKVDPSEPFYGGRFQTTCAALAEDRRLYVSPIHGPTSIQTAFLVGHPRR